jgi:hypothetical protein
MTDLQGAILIFMVAGTLLTRWGQKLYPTTLNTVTYFITLTCTIVFIVSLFS